MYSAEISSTNQVVHVVDDDLIIRILLENILLAADLKVKTYASAEEFLLKAHPPIRGCIVLDNFMPGMNGIELQEILASHGNNAPVIFLTGSGDVSIAVKALKGGALDFLEKPVEPSAVLMCVIEALKTDTQKYDKRLKHLQTNLRIGLLTPREHEVMNLIVQGKTNKAMASTLGISGRTVEIHRKNVTAKMQAESVADLVQMVLEAKEE